MICLPYDLSADLSSTRSFGNVSWNVVPNESFVNVSWKVLSNVLYPPNISKWELCECFLNFFKCFVSFKYFHMRALWMFPNESFVNVSWNVLFPPNISKWEPWAVYNEMHGPALRIPDRTPLSSTGSNMMMMTNICIGKALWFFALFSCVSIVHCVSCPDLLLHPSGKSVYGQILCYCCSCWSKQNVSEIKCGELFQTP